MKDFLYLKLKELEKEITNERAMLESKFLNRRSLEELKKRSHEQILSEYNNEIEILKKYKMNSNQMIEYIVELDFSLADLNNIFYYHKN